MKYLVSDDEHVFTNGEEFDSREEAIAWGEKEYMPGDEFWTGIKGESPRPVISAGDLESMFDSWLDGMKWSEDFADNWPDVSEAALGDLAKDLTVIFHVWLDRHKAWPKWFPVDHVEKHTVQS